MKKINLTIWDVDCAYSKALAAYIANHYDLFKVNVLFDKESLRDDAEKKISDIYLINEEVSIEGHNKGVVIYLSEEIKKSEHQDISIGTVFKYRSADELVGAIKYYYELLSGKKIQGIPKTSKMIGFFSPAGGTGKTVTALGVARTIASFGKKVLYLNLESIPSTYLFFKSSKDGKCLSDFLFFLFIKDEQEQKRNIYEFMTRDEWGVHCFVPQGSYSDLMNLTDSEMRYFLDTLCKGIDFEYICVDTTSILDKHNALVCSMCYKVFNILTESMMCSQKQAVLNQYFKAGSKFNAFENSISVLNRYQQEEPKGCFTISHDDNMDRGIDLNGPFGKGIKKIADHILFE